MPGTDGLEQRGCARIQFFGFLDRNVAFPAFERLGIECGRQHITERHQEWVFGFGHRFEESAQRTRCLFEIFSIEIVSCHEQVIIQPPGHHVEFSQHIPEQFEIIPHRLTLQRSDCHLQSGDEQEDAVLEVFGFGDDNSASFQEQQAH